MRKSTSNFEDNYSPQIRKIQIENMQVRSNKSLKKMLKSAKSPKKIKKVSSIVMSASRSAKTNKVNLSDSKKR